MSLGKFNSGQGYNFERTIEDIIIDYARHLLEKGVISDDEFVYFTNEGRGETLDVLFEKLYETKDLKRRTVNTLSSFKHFCKFVVKEYLGQPVWNNFVRDMFLAVEQNKNTGIMASRSLGKSFFLYSLYPLYKMFLYDKTKFLNVSNIPTQCVENLRHFNNIVNRNEMLFQKKNVEKGKDLKWTERQKEYNEGMIITVSAGTSPRGLHVHYTIVDDMITEGCQLNDEEAINYVFGQLYPTVQRNKGRMIISGTPIHKKDLYHYIMGEEEDFEGDIITDGRISWKGFYSKTFPIATEDGEPLYPSIFSKEEIFGPSGIKETQGDLTFEREYMLKSIDESKTLFPEHLILSVTDTEYKYIYSANEPEDKNRRFVVCCDVATSADISADFSAFIVIELIKTELGYKKVIRHIVHERGMDVSEQIKTIARLAQLFNNARVVVEKNNVGVALIQELAKMNVNVEEFVTTKDRKNDMIRYLQREMKNKNIWLPETTNEITKLKKELMNFGIKVTRGGNERFQALSGHDDMVMALAIGNYSAQNESVLPKAILNKRKTR